MNLKGQALALWEELTGQAVNSTQYKFSVNGEDFDLYGANKRVKEALEIADDVTVTLIIKTLARRFAEFETFSLADIMSDNERLQIRIDLVKRLQALFSEPSINERHEEFYAYCEGALAHYRNREVSDSDRKFVRGAAGFVGLDAYHGVDKLTRLMVTDGPLGDIGQAKVSQFVFAFDSIEQLISHVRQIPTGFSLCAILAPHISDSYFVMAIRNGERTLVLSDKGNYSHPLQEGMMRSRNDRYNLDRIDHSHFPYALLNIVWGDNGRHAGKSSESKKLELAENGLRVLGSLGELDNWDLLWLHLFIDQCRHRYFKQQHTEPRLAIGSMIRLPHKWLQGEGATLPVPCEFELEFETRTSAELNTDFLYTIEPKWRALPATKRWMEERFAAMVPNEALYIPAQAIDDSKVPLLTYGAKGVPALAPTDLSGMHGYDRSQQPIVRLLPLSNTALSTPERVTRDAHFIARHNQVAVIKKLVEDDFEARKNEVLKWFYKAAAKNLPNLLDDLLTLNHERFQIDTPEMLAQWQNVKSGFNPEEGFRPGTIAHRLKRPRAVTLRYTPSRKQHPARRDTPPSLSKALKLEEYYYGSTHCVLDRDQEAQVFIGLETTLVLDLMLITGLSLKDIPPELHSRGTEVYVGNNILDRLDPLSNVRNPWKNLKLHYSVPVSLQAFKAYRRKKGLKTPAAPELEAFARESAPKAEAPPRDPFPGLSGLAVDE